MSDLRVNLADAQDSGDKAEFADVKKKIAKMQKKLKGRPVLTSSETIIEVPAGGLEDLKLELSELLAK